MKWCFITECEKNTTVGTGHIKRMITFANYVRGLRNEIRFIINNNNYAIELLNKNNFEYKINDNLIIESNLKFNIIFIDTYDKYKNDKFIEIQKKHCDKLVIISDSYKKENIKADVMIYTNESLKAVITSHNILTGAKYLIIDNCFSTNKKNFSKEIRNILVTFGGYDPYNVTLKSIKALKMIQKILLNKKINILLGSLYPYRYELLGYLKNTQLNYYIYQNLNNIGDFFKQQDYAITAGGNTFYELSSLGIPSSTLAQTKRQAKALNAIKKELKINYIGYYKNVTIKKLAASLHDNIQNFRKRKENFEHCIEFFKNDSKKLIYNKIMRGT